MEIYIYINVCVGLVFLSWWWLRPEYTPTHGDSCHRGDLNWGPHGKQAYKSYRMSFFENVKSFLWGVGLGVGQ